MTEVRMSTHPEEIELRRRWYLAHRNRYFSDQSSVAEGEQADRGFLESADEALALLQKLNKDRGLEEFRVGMQEWAVKPGTLAFNGFSGQMMINQLVKRSGDLDALAGLLADALSVPTTTDDAIAKTRRVEEYVETVRAGAHPAPGHIPFLLSYFWGLADHRRWPVLWTSAAGFLEFTTGDSLPTVPHERVAKHLRLVEELGDDPFVFSRVAMWWHSSRPVFLDPVLADRAKAGLNADAVDDLLLEQNAKALVSVGKYIGNELVDELSTAAGRSLKARTPSKDWSPDRPRSDFWVDWRAPNLSTVGLRLWVNHNGAALGLRPGDEGGDWIDETSAHIDQHPVSGFEKIAVGQSSEGRDVGFEGGWPGQFVYAKWVEPEIFAGIDVRRQMQEVASATQPLLDAFVNRVAPSPADASDGWLAVEVERFLTERGYPTEMDKARHADRRYFATILAEDALPVIAAEDLRQIINTGRYGSPGPMSTLNSTLTNADAAEYDEIIETLIYLLWNDGPVEERIDSLLGDRKIAGLGESVIMKLLAITQPDRFIPVFPASGPKGKRQMLRVLGLDDPQFSGRGELHVKTNDLLRERLDPFFPGDAWAMAQFLYWFSESRDAETDGGTESESLSDALAAAAEDLLVDEAFLDEIVALLRDKGQVIFYGPPGTGKTYLARRLAEALAPDPTRRSLVQFHPSTSYEDFFEGYRPEVDPEGQMTYRLTRGPMARIAERSQATPGKRHVMIIDEINRANLPKVLGELLFLFEYRDEQVQTQYRPDDPFELPQDLWFIGTMNTADRSIALVDAALRRRFHFVPFFPNHGPMAGLLDRWLDKNDEPAWVGELVALVNEELEERLGGPHLQLGPSHFMRKGLSESHLRSIWQYNIEPFVEDQFFGDADQIGYFRFDAVLRRFRDLASTAELDPEGGAADESVGPA